MEAAGRAFRSRMLSTTLIGLTLVASAVHFIDNALRLDLYPGPIWLTRDRVLLAWGVLFVLAWVALRLDTRWALIGYGLLGFAGLLHYLQPHSSHMPIRCTLTIAAECISSALLIAYAASRREACATQRRPVYTT